MSMKQDGDQEQFEEPHDAEFRPLLELLAKIPAIKTNQTLWGGFGTDRSDDGKWWVKFVIDIRHAMAWNLIQEFGCILNYLSIEDRLPTIFKPVSPAPYLNGGPDDFLSWTIECWDAEFLPANAAEWLEARLPNPIEDVNAWIENQ
jgi:hypothetical protein